MCHGHVHLRKGSRLCPFLPALPVERAFRPFCPPVPGCTIVRGKERKKIPAGAFRTHRSRPACIPVKFPRDTGPA